MLLYKYLLKYNKISCIPGRIRTLTDRSVVWHAVHYTTRTFGVGYRIRTDVSGFADHCLNPSANQTCFVKVPGLEPRLTEPKSVVLPLHHTSISCRSRKTRTLTDGFGDRNAPITPYSCMFNDMDSYILPSNS